jgi:hypothetical protein
VATMLEISHQRCPASVAQALLNVSSVAEACSFRSTWTRDGDSVVFPDRPENQRLVDVAETQIAYADVADLIKTLAA